MACNVCACIYEISHKSSGHDDHLDHILGGTVSDELVEMTESPGCSQNLLGIMPAPMNDAGSTMELPPREGRTGELWGGDSCHRPCLSLADVLPLPHPLISHVNNPLASSLHPQKFISAQIKH